MNQLKFGERPSRQKLKRQRESMNVEALAKKYGRCESTVYKWLTDYKLVVPMGYKPPLPTAAEVIELLKTKTLEQVGQQYGRTSGMPLRRKLRIHSIAPLSRLAEISTAALQAQLQRRESLLIAAIHFRVPITQLKHLFQMRGLQSPDETLGAEMNYEESCDYLRRTDTRTARREKGLTRHQVTSWRYNHSIPAPPTARWIERRKLAAQMVELRKTKTKPEVLTEMGLTRKEYKKLGAIHCYWKASQCC